MSDHPAAERPGCIEILILAALLMLGFFLAIYLDSVIQGMYGIKTGGS